MGLIDHRILQQGPGSLLGAGLEGWDRGQQARDAMLQRRALAEQQKRQQEEHQQQQQAQMRKQAFEQNARGLLSSYGEFAYTPEGRKGLVNDLTKAGFGPEAMGLFGQMDSMMPEKPKAAPDSWDQLHGTDQIYNRRDGAFRAAPKPTTSSATPAAPAWKGERFVRSKGNAMVKVDASGKDQSGNVVELWTPPAKPKAMPTPKPPSPVKGLSGDASKLLSISWTLQDDISAMNKAFQDNYEGAIAGMKSGTNKRLMDLADQIADKVGRLRSGGAVNADEEKRFMRLIATLRGAAFSNANEAAETLNSLAREGAIVAEAMDPGGGHRKRITESMRPAAPKTSQSFTKPEEEDEYQAWKKAQGIK